MNLITFCDRRFLYISIRQKKPYRRYSLPYGFFFCFIKALLLRDQPNANVRHEAVSHDQNVPNL